MKEMQFKAVEIYATAIQIVEVDIIVLRQIIPPITILKTLIIFYGHFLMYLT